MITKEDLTRPYETLYVRLPVNLTYSIHDIFMAGLNAIKYVGLRFTLDRRP